MLTADYAIRHVPQTDLEPNYISSAAAPFLTTVESLFRDGALKDLELAGVQSNGSSRPHFTIDVPFSWHESTRKEVERVINQAIEDGGTLLHGWTFEVVDNSNLELPQAPPANQDQVETDTPTADTKLLGDTPNAIAIAPPTMSTEMAAQVDKAIATVAAKLTDALAPEEGSAVFSAPGVTALMMFAANGTAPGAERDAFLSALGLDGMCIEDVNLAAAALTYKLGTLGKGIRVNVANLAVSNSLKSGGFVPGFVESAASGATTTAIDGEVSGEAQVAELTKRINTWVEDNTGGDIDSIIDEGKVGDLVWYLLSAISFEGTWTKPFTDAGELLADPEFLSKVEGEYEFREKVAGYLNVEPWSLNDKDAEDVQAELAAAHKKASVFTKTDGTQVEQNMMRLCTGGLRFIDSPKFEAVMLPYGETAEGAYMVAMLPKGDVTPKELLARVGTPAFEGQLSTPEKRSEAAEDVVNLPRFKTTFDPTSGKVLGAFRDIVPLQFGALINKGSAEPNDAVLKATIDVGPRSTKASQVAGMGGLEAMVVGPPPKELSFDRPFAYAIVARGDWNPLFQGVFDGQEGAAVVSDIPSLDEIKAKVTQAHDGDRMTVLNATEITDIIAKLNSGDYPTFELMDTPDFQETAYLIEGELYVQEGGFGVPSRWSRVES